MRCPAALLLPALLVLQAQDPEAWKPRPGGTVLALGRTAATVKAGGTLRLSATWTGPDPGPLTWSATGGTVDAGGTWTAPQAPGRYVVSVQAQDPAIAARATFEVRPVGPVASLRPPRIALLPGQAFPFTLETHGTGSARGRWSATHGTVDPKGTFRATQPGKGTVTVSFPGGPSATAEVEVVAPTRAGSRHLIAYATVKDLAQGRFLPRDAQGLTHLCLSFIPMKEGLLAPDAETLKALKAAATLKAHHPSLKLVASVGGWGVDTFSAMAATETGRARFTASAVDLLEAHRLDGLDLDWEYPCYAAMGGHPGDFATYPALLQDLREALRDAAQRTGHPLSLSAALPAGPDQQGFYDWPKVLPLLDRVHLMTYDYHGPYEPFTAFHAPLQSVREEGRGLRTLSAEATVQAFLARGARPEQLILGLPFYGKAYRASGPRPGEAAQGPGHPAFLPWRDVSSLLRSGSWVRSRHPEAAQLQLWQAATRTWINVDDPDSMRLKAAYALQQGLGGVMFWDLGLDDGSLLAALREGLAR